MRDAEPNASGLGAEGGQLPPRQVAAQGGCGGLGQGVARLIRTMPALPAT